MSVPSYIKDSLIPFKDFTDLKVSVVKINPFGNSTFSSAGQNEIQFKLPRFGVLVPNKSKFYFEAKVDGDSASDDQLMSDAHTIFDRHIVEVGNMEVDRQEEYGWWKSLEFDAKASSADRTSVSSTIMGVPAKSASGSFKKYCLPLASKWDNKGFFKDPLPLFHMDQMTLKWFINQSLAEFTTASTAVTTLDIQNAVLECYIVDSPTIRKLFQSGDLIREFQSQYHYQAKLPSGVTSFNINVPASYQNIRGLAVLQRDSVDPVDPDWETGTALATYKYTNAFQLNGLSKFSVSVDGIQFPDREVDLTDYVELIPNVERFWGVDRMGDWFDSIDATDGKNYMALSFAGAEDGVNGLNMQSKSGTIIVNGTFSSGISASTDLDIFIVYNRFYKIGKSGEISVTK
jgi:hypothetical protein